MSDFILFWWCNDCKDYVEAEGEEERCPLCEGCNVEVAASVRGED